MVRTSDAAGLGAVRKAMREVEGVGSGVGAMLKGEGALGL